MTVTVLFAASTARWSEYEEPLTRALADAGVDARLGMEFDPADVDYIVYAPNSAVQDFTPYTRLKAVLNLWAGVEDVVGNPTLHVPLARMVDEGLTRGMVEWVTGHTLRHHLGMDAHIHGLKGEWRIDVPPLAEDRPVTILGLGTLGTACATTLAGLGFRVTGWSRSRRSVDNVTCLSGPEGLAQALSSAEILILLLPDTPATENTLDADALAALPQGAVVLNPGRGTLIDDDALLAALDSGHVAHATLDTFRTEPLPKDHSYWSHPKVTVTPHVSAITRPMDAVDAFLAHVEDFRAGRPLDGAVDLSRGY